MCPLVHGSVLGPECGSGDSERWDLLRVIRPVEAQSLGKGMTSFVE